MSVARLYNYVDAVVMVSDDPFSLAASELQTLSYFFLGIQNQSFVRGLQRGSRDPMQSVFEKSTLHTTMKLLQEIQCLSSS